MRSLILFIAAFLLCLSAFAQNDEINLKSGKTIKGQIIKLDNDAGTIVYKNSKTGITETINLTNVGSYIWNGELNAGFVAPVSAYTSEPIIENTAQLQRIIPAGIELKRFANLAQIGIGLGVTGSIIVALPAILTSEGKDPAAVENRTQYLTTIGVLTSSVGFVILFASFSSARKAGKILQLGDNLSMNATPDGLGLTFNLQKK